MSTAKLVERGVLASPLGRLNLSIIKCLYCSEGIIYDSQQPNKKFCNLSHSNKYRSLSRIK
jgi:hypothetical protein